jgi:broad specificity phosphatase PhoE
MDRLVLARHAETGLNLRGVVNGDPSVASALTARGRREAVELGAAAGPVDLATHTEFERTRETAELAWPRTPLVAIAELNEIAFGRFEGTAFDDGYAAWAWNAGPAADCPGGGESRAAALVRYCRGFRALLRRPEAVVAHVGHGAPIRYLLNAAGGSPPPRRLDRIPHAQPFALGAHDVARAVELLEAWLREPAWR